MQAVQLNPTASGILQRFARGMHLEGHCLYAAYASYDERGARKYWLLKPLKLPYKTKKAIKVQGDTTIKIGTLVVDAGALVSLYLRRAGPQKLQADDGRNRHVAGSFTRSGA